MKDLVLIISFIGIIIITSASAQSIQGNDFRSLPVVQWKFKIAKPFVSSPVIDNNVIYTGSLDSNLYALDLKTGKLNWKFRTNGIIRSTIAINGSNLFLVSGDGNLYSIDKGKGSVNWTYHTKCDKPYDIYDYFQSSPVVDHGVVYFGCGDGNVYAIDGTDGRLLWNFQTGDVVHSTPAITDGKLFIGSFDGNVYALDEHSGALIWKFKSVGQFYFPKGEMQFSPVVANGLVFIGGRDFNLYAIDENKGYCHWNKYYPKGWAPVITSSQQNDSLIFVGTSDPRILEVINGVTGEIKWSTMVKSNLFGKCIFTPGMCYAGSLAGKIYGIDLKDGSVIWTFATDGSMANHDTYFNADDFWNKHVLNTFTTNEEFLSALDKMGAIYSAPAIAGNLMVISSSDGTIYCLEKT